MGRTFQGAIRSTTAMKKSAKPSKVKPPVKAGHFLARIRKFRRSTGYQPVTRAATRQHRQDACATHRRARATGPIPVRTHPGEGHNVENTGVVGQKRPARFEEVRAAGACRSNLVTTLRVVTHRWTVRVLASGVDGPLAPQWIPLQGRRASEQDVRTRSVGTRRNVENTGVC